MLNGTKVEQLTFCNHCAGSIILLFKGNLSNKNESNTD